jgi:hypothetical protein
MTAGSPTEPFALLGVGPFLHAESADLDRLKKRFTQLARASHPDLVPEGDDEAREAAEARSAALNSAWRRIQDFEGRLELAVASAALPEGQKPSFVAPEIALRYFELQELLLDGALEARPKLDALKAEVAERLRQELGRLHEIARRYPLTLTEEALAASRESWSLDSQDLSALRDGRNAVRYLERLAEDLEKNS